MSLVSDGKSLRQPASQREWKKCKEENENNINVIQICVSVYISSSTVMLFTCRLVLSRQSARQGLSAKLEPLEQTARYWVGQSKQEIYLGERTSQRGSLTLDRGHEGRICQVLQEDGRSSIKYVQNYNRMIAHIKKISMSFCNMLPVCYYDYFLSAS